MQSYQFKESPLLLLSYSEGSREFKLSDEGKAFLCNLQLPIAVIGVAGMYRTGKSYLLNRMLLDRRKGFGVGPSVNPCTKGIWIWGTPVAGRTIDGQPCSVVILDTEGIGALDQDSDHDSRIFSLTVLIVSCFIYNSRGSIDEEALNNLSLVVNLTKHIQIKSKGNEEVGTEEYAAYFPSFVWVVRDFALKLVDEEGEPLTAKEYLEKALNAQKGFSDLAEEKNRIRRLLKEFFKDRECFTLVRPVNNENDLHKLEELEFSELRPEFVEQVRALRSKIINCVKPKTLNGRLLDGEMLCELIESYVHAVNKGAVPNIENAWNYICKNECAKAFEDAIALYTRKIDDLTVNNFPDTLDAINEYHREARKACCGYFKSRALGEETKSTYVKLKETMHEKHCQLKFTNEVESEKLSAEFLRNNYMRINSKLKGNEYKSFLEFEREMRNFQQVFKDSGPRGPNRDKILLQFCQSKLIEGADIYMKALNNELEIIQETTAEKIKILEMDTNEFREQIKKEKVELVKKMEVIEHEKKEMEEKDEEIKKVIEELKEEKNDIEAELREAMRKLEEELVGEIKKAKAQAGEFEKLYKKTDTALNQKMSEFAETSALFDQKIAYLEKTIADLKKHEKDLETENKALSKTHSEAIKDLQNRSDSQIKTLENKLSQEQDIKFNLEKELDEVTQHFSQEKTEFIESQQKMQLKIDDLSQQLKTLTQNSDKKEKDLLSKIRENDKTAEDNISKLKKKTEEAEKKAKKYEDTLKTEMNKMEKDNAVLMQKTEFLETQLKECKEQLDEERKQHSVMMIHLSSMTDSSKNLELELEQLKEKHANEVKYIESQNDANKKELLSEIEKLTQAKTDIELRFKLDSSEWHSKQETITEELNSLSQERDRLRDQIQDLKRRLETVTTDLETKLRAKTIEHDKMVDGLTERFSKELELTKKTAETIQDQLKGLYEEEKKRFELRLQEEKEKSDKRCRKVVEEYEDRIKNDQENWEEELAQKENQMNELESYMNEEVTGLKHKGNLDAQKISGLENYIKELKEQIESMEKSYRNMLEVSQNRFDSERKALQEKIDRMLLDLAGRDKEISMMSFKKQQVDEQIVSQNGEIKELRVEIDMQKQGLMKKIDELKAQSKQLNNDLITCKSDSKREMALLQQENDFKSNRINEIDKVLKEIEEKYRDTVKLLKTEGGKDNTAIEKLTEDKDMLERKLSEKKKTMAQLNAGFSKQISQLEKEKAALNERYLNLESKIAEIEYRNNEEREKLLLQIQEKHIDDDMSEENEKLKELINELQRELNEKNAVIDKERVLWENKFAFLVQQKDTAKSDLYEAQRKFEFTLQQLQKREQTGKEKHEGTMNSLISSIEARYNSQIKDLQESNISSLEQLNLKLKLADQEIKGLKEELEISRRGKNLITGNIDKRCRQLQEIEAKLISEIDNLRVEKDKKTREIEDSAGFEKEQMRNKIIDMEKKVKDAEMMKSQMYLELEKERSKWQMERDHLLNAKNEALEIVERLESRKDLLMRENERLKGEKLKTRFNSGKRSEYHKAHNSQLVGSPSKLPEFHSQRVIDQESIREDTSGDSRRRSFAD